MNTLYYKDYIFYYITENSAEIILNCKQPLSNKSQIAMHSLVDSALTIPKLLVDQTKRHHIYYEGTDLYTLDVIYLLVDILVTQKAISSPLPTKTLALGCDNGVLAFHLADILGTIHSQSILHFVCNNIVNNGNNPILDIMPQIQNLPDCSLSISDYHNTLLQGQSFDIVVIDDLISLPEPLLTIKEAERLIKQQGLFITITKNHELIAHLQDKYNTLKIYCFNDIYVLAIFNITVSEKNEPSFSEYMLSNLSEIKNTFSENSSEQQIKQIICNLDNHISNAMRCQKLDWKIYCIKVKEAFLNYLLHTNLEFKVHYLQEISSLLTNLPLNN